jgi:hypothetical protein
VTNQTNQPRIQVATDDSTFYLLSQYQDYKKMYDHPIKSTETSPTNSTVISQGKTMEMRMYKILRADRLR